MADLIHGSGGDVVPEQVWDPALNSGQGGMEIVNGSSGSLDVSISSSSVAIPVDIQYSNLPTNNPLLVNQVQRNCTYLDMLDNLSITDTTAHYSVSFDASVFQPKGKALMVTNNLNQTVNIQLLIYAPTGSGVYYVPAKSVTAGQLAVFTSADIPQLDAALMTVKVTATCSVAPTSGTVYVQMFGAPV